MQIREAVSADVRAMLECDPYAQSSRERAQSVAASVAQRHCLIAIDGVRVLGYLVLKHDFFEQGFISLVVVSPTNRRNGVGLQLFLAAEAACTTPKLFTSTNLSNLASQKLIMKAGFRRSGIVENLDEGDPELIYVKFLR
ncbi:GNAT family N-acetyltransferase [Variovorax sp. tm]|uniref:GNAT family N-acetyltransferase n=1 Tax=Variovorax atrisoli TaxID=3394203 RepID=UPI003A809D38